MILWLYDNKLLIAVLADSFRSGVKCQDLQNGAKKSSN